MLGMRAIVATIPNATPFGNAIFLKVKFFSSEISKAKYADNFLPINRPSTRQDYCLSGLSPNNTSFALTSLREPITC